MGEILRLTERISSLLDLLSHRFSEDTSLLTAEKISLAAGAGAISVICGVTTRPSAGVQWLRSNCSNLSRQPIPEKCIK